MMTVFFWYYLLGLFILWLGRHTVVRKTIEGGYGFGFVIFFVAIFPIVYIPILIYTTLVENDR